MGQADSGLSDLEQMRAELQAISSSKRPSPKSRAVDAMLDCIHRRVFDPRFNVAEMRRICRIADNNRSSRFRQFLGQSPRQYIESLRLDSAATLLHRYPQACAPDIAYLVGYEHPQTFYRAFKRRFGGSPKRVLERLTSSLAAEL